MTAHDVPERPRQADEPQLLREDIRLLWDFQKTIFIPEHVDFVLAVGCEDERVAELAARLCLEGRATYFIASGGFGKKTRDTWAVQEAHRFADIARTMGVAPHLVLEESRATNVGENIVLTLGLLKVRNIAVERGVLVAKPHTALCALATAAKQWASVEWYVRVPDIPIEEYADDVVPLHGVIDWMLCDLERLKVFGEAGLVKLSHIPPTVWASVERLRCNGMPLLSSASLGHEQVVHP